MDVAAKVLPKELEIIAKRIEDKGAGSIAELQREKVLASCDDDKLASMALCNVIVIEQGVVHLTELGEKLAEACSERDKRYVYLELLDTIYPYKDILQCFVKNDDSEKVLTVDDVAHIWRGTSYKNLASQNVQSLKEKAVCFFRLCDAAGIGRLYLGRRGKQTRFECDRDSLLNGMKYIHSAQYMNKDEEDTIEETSVNEYESISNTDQEDEEKIMNKNTEIGADTDDIVRLNVPFLDGRNACMTVPKDADKEEVRYVADMINLFLKRQFGMDDN